VRRLNVLQLQALGAPVKGGAQQIEDWLRSLLCGGTLRLECGLVELRGGQPVVTTLGDLKRACGVAMETVKQGLRALEMEHWVQLVDGVHTRLLGPPRFRVSVTKENISGSVGRAISVAPMDGLNPLESIDYDQLRRPASIVSHKDPGGRESGLALDRPPAAGQRTTGGAKAGRGLYAGRRQPRAHRWPTRSLAGRPAGACGRRPGGALGPAH
jgi:hypothetical protein